MLYYGGRYFKMVSYELSKKELDMLAGLLQLSKISIEAGLKNRPNLIVKRKLNQLDKGLLIISSKFDIIKELEIDINKHL